MISKFLITTLVLALTFSSVGQSKYGFQIGVDTTMLKFNVKSKVEYTLTYDSIGNVVDSIFSEKTYFDSLGYIVKLEKEKSGYVSFKYNQFGYLINEDLNWRGAIGWFGLDTILKKEIIIWEEFEYTSRMKEETIIYNYNSSDEYKRRFLYTYGKKGELISVITFNRNNKLSTLIYEYNEIGLLVGKKYVANNYSYETKYIYEFH